MCVYVVVVGPRLLAFCGLPMFLLGIWLFFCAFRASGWCFGACIFLGFLRFVTYVFPYASGGSFKKDSWFLPCLDVFIVFVVCDVWTLHIRYDRCWSLIYVYFYFFYQETVRQKPHNNFIIKPTTYLHDRKRKK